MRTGRYWMRLSRFFTMAASWRGVLQEPGLPRLFFMSAQAPLHRIQVGGVSGQPGHGQPLSVGLDEGAHQGAFMGVQVVPHENQRGMKLMVRGGDQARVVGFGHGPALAFAAGVQADPVEEPAAGTGPVAGHPRRRYSPGAFPGHHGDGGGAAAGPGAGLGRPQRLPGLVLKAQVRPGRRR